MYYNILIMFVSLTRLKYVFISITRKYIHPLTPHKKQNESSSKAQTKFLANPLYMFQPELIYRELLETAKSEPY